jgi:hypothetical protein
MNAPDLVTRPFRVGSPPRSLALANPSQVIVLFVALTASR